MSTGHLAAGELIAPDGGFVRDVLRLGGDAAKKCFQCGTCSVVCPLSPTSGPFPRKEMIWVQWGLKDRLLQDPDVWLCYQCSDCSSYCPRGSRPGDVMAAIRGYAIARYAVPGFLARALARFQLLPVLLGLSVLLFYGFLSLIPSPPLPARDVLYLRFLIVAFLSLTVAIVGLVRFWRRIRRFQIASSVEHRTADGSSAGGARPEASTWSVVIPTLVDILKHAKFGKCGVDRLRYYSHLATLYGFLLLFAATVGRAAYHFLAGRDPAPPLADPVKIAGNLGGLLLLGGLTLVLFIRLTRKSDLGRSTYFDWVFILALYLTTATGFIAQVARLVDAGAIAWQSYLLHLLFAFTLLAYAPYSKFAHIFYRSAALLAARQMGREAAPSKNGELQ